MTVARLPATEEHRSSGRPMWSVTVRSSPPRLGARHPEVQGCSRPFPLFLSLTSFLCCFCVLCVIYTCKGRCHGTWVEVRGQVPRSMGGGQRVGSMAHGWRSEGRCHGTCVKVREQLSGITSIMGSRDQTQAVRSVGASLFPTKPNH